MVLGCDFTIHIGKPPITRHRPFPVCLLSKYELDYEKAAKQPSLVIGECSFLKYGLTQDKSFIPEPIFILSDLIPPADSGKSVKIDDELIKKVAEAMSKPNTTGYEIYVSKQVVVEFLRKHKGKECYYVCW